MRSLMLVASALFLGSCPQGPDLGHCPSAWGLESGTYFSPGLGTWSGQTGSFPHDNGQPKVLRLELAAKRMRTIYQRDGQEVVETWRPSPGQRDWPIDASAD